MHPRMHRIVAVSYLIFASHVQLPKEGDVFIQLRRLQLCVARLFCPCDHPRLSDCPRDLVHLRIPDSTRSPMTGI